MHIKNLALAESATDEALAREEQMNSPPLQGTVFSGFLLRLLRTQGSGGAASGGGVAPSFCFEQHASLWVLYPSAICCFRSVAQAARVGLAGAVGRFTFGPRSKVCSRPTAWRLGASALPSQLLCCSRHLLSTAHRPSV